MPKKRLSVKKTREILRLRFECGLSERKIATSCAIARSTVADYLNRAREAALTWPLPDDVTEDALEELLFPARPHQKSRRPLPDWETHRKELTRDGVTMQLLFEEYREKHPDGYSRSRFFDLYRIWKGTIDPVMRIEHKAGDKLFVDYSGQTVAVELTPKVVYG